MCEVFSRQRDRASEDLENYEISQQQQDDLMEQIEQSDIVKDKNDQIRGLEADKKCLTRKIECSSREIDCLELIVKTLKRDQAAIYKLIDEL
jgi:hypothetical protein